MVEKCLEGISKCFHSPPDQENRRIISFSQDYITSRIGGLRRSYYICIEHNKLNLPNRYTIDNSQAEMNKTKSFFSAVSNKPLLTEHTKN